MPAILDTLVRPAPRPLATGRSLHEAQNLSIGADDLNSHVFYCPILHFYLLAALFGTYFVSGYATDALSNLRNFETTLFL